MIPLFVTVAVVLVALGGWLAAADSALGVLSRADLTELGRSSRTRRSLEAIAADVGAHVNAVNFMRVVVETTAAVLVTLALASAFTQWWWVLLLSAFIMTVASFVLVGSSPRAIGRFNARAVIRWSAPLVHGSRVVLGPIANALVAIGDRVTPGRPRTVSFSSEEQLLSMVDEATAQDVLEEDDRELIHSIFEFNDTVVREVMVPRTDMVVIDGDETVGAAMTLLLEHGVSRIPVIGSTIDEVLGILYLRDVAQMAVEKSGELNGTASAAIARPALFVPESQNVDELLRLMQRESNHLAMVVDEYGGIAGLVTLEDIIEELVGDISDEYDREVVDVQVLDDEKFRVSARLPIDELGDLFGIELDDDDVDSVGGLLAKALGRLPNAGAVAHTAGLVLTADRTEKRGRRLRTVIVERDSRADAQDDRAVDGEAAASGRTNEREGQEAER